MNQRQSYDWPHIEQGIPAVQVRNLEGLGITREDIRTIIPDRTLDRRINASQNLTLDEADGIAPFFFGQDRHFKIPDHGFLLGDRDVGLGGGDPGLFDH